MSMLTARSDYEAIQVWLYSKLDNKFITAQLS
jgi:hypothetical protein